MKMLNQSEKIKKYNKAYWGRYINKVGRISFTLPRSEYLAAKKEADRNGRPLGQHVREEWRAYRKHEYLPSAQVEAILQALSVELSRIGNNLNQQMKVSHIFREVFSKKGGLAYLEQLEDKIYQAVVRLRQ